MSGPKVKGISPIADHWRAKAETLERALARRDALLREIIGYKFCPNDVKERIQAELGASQGRKK